MDKGGAKPQAAKALTEKAKNNDRRQKEKAQNNKKNDSTNVTHSSQKRSKVSVLHGSFWLTRIVIIKYMGFIYGVAFLVSLLQNKELIGKDGLLPADLYLSTVKGHAGNPAKMFTLMSYAPTLFWFVNSEDYLDFWLDAIAWVGLSISIFMVVTGAGNWPLLFCQWVLYHSLVNVGQRWFSFGWESQVLETGFLTIFLCPLLSLSSLPKATPPSFVVIFAYRWLIFRIMLGAGLIKIRGDKCWRALTCMNYHYETQPVPNPLSYYLHQTPEAMHKFEVLSNHFIELIAPFLLLLSRKFAMIGGAIQILFQVVLIISGNLSFLNWLTILPNLACFDDASLEWLTTKTGGAGKVLRVRSIIESYQRSPQNSLDAGLESRSWCQKFSLSDISVSLGRPLRLAVNHCQEQLRPPNNWDKLVSTGTYIRRALNICLGLLLAYLSIPVIQNLISRQQAMNTSFDPLRLINTYGAFGSITKKRTEVIFQGTSSLDPYSPDALWEEYEFKCKPGNVKRRPCVISPYHYRLDWLMWFAAFQNYQHNPWLVHVAGKLLTNSNVTDSLMDFNPFKEKSPPTFIRADHYRYWYTKLDSAEAKSGAWWTRKKIGTYLPVVSLQSLKPVFQQMGWKLT